MSLFDNIKIGDQLKDKETGRIITIINIREEGIIDYTCKPYTIKLSMYNFGIVKGGTLQIKDPICKIENERQYEKFEGENDAS